MLLIVVATALMLAIFGINYGLKALYTEAVRIPNQRSSSEPRRLMTNYQELLDKAKTEQEHDRLLEQWADEINAGTWRPLPKIDPARTISSRYL